MKNCFVLIAASFFVLFLLFGCTSTVQKPVPEGKNCDQNQECFGTSFFACEQAYGNLSPDTESQFYFQIIGVEGEKCKVYVQLIKAKDVPDFAKGLDAICKVSPAELAASGGNVDLGKQDCTGPLYDALKAAQAVQGAEQ